MIMSYLLEFGDVSIWQGHLIVFLSLNCGKVNFTLLIPEVVKIPALVFHRVVSSVLVHLSLRTNSFMINVELVPVSTSTRDSVLGLLTISIDLYN